MAEKPEWVEMMEPQSGDIMYANLKTGQCLWEPPSGVRVKKANESQWWELYDHKTKRYYYYNAASKKTVWHKPKDCDIIPLAKLQAMKAREKRKAARTKERESSHRREGSERHRREGSEGHRHGSHVRRESSGRREGSGLSRDGSGMRRSGRDKRERTNSREQRSDSAQQDQSHDREPVGAPSNDIDRYATATNHVRENGIAAEEEDESLEEAMSLPAVQEAIASLTMLTKGSDSTEEDGYVTPSGTFKGSDKLGSPSGLTLSPEMQFRGTKSPFATLDQDTTSLSPTGSFSHADRQPREMRDTGADENGCGSSSSEESLSVKLQAGGMPATTAKLVEACSPPDENDEHSPTGYDNQTCPSITVSPSEDSGQVFLKRHASEYTNPTYNVSSLHRPLKHSRQHSDSALGELRGEDDDEDEDDGGVASEGSSTLPRTSRPSSIGSPTSPVHRSTLERSHSVPTSKPPAVRGLAAYGNYLNHHTKGIFRKKRMSVNSMLSWSKVPIKKPLIMIPDRHLKREAVEVFRLVQGYMGDRSLKGKRPERLVLELTTKGWSTPILRDEIYMQLCKQTTLNGRPSSLERGWQLMAICLSLFPPSIKFHSYLEGYISRHLENSDWKGVRVSKYANHCYKRLERITQAGAKRGIKKPTLEEIEQAKNVVFNPSMFGATLEDIMKNQEDRFPDLKLPWILTTLAEAVLQQNGSLTEGIFRVPGDIDEVNALKVRLDRYEPPTGVGEPHVPASLLKLWFRELYEPLISEAYYENCVENCNDSTVAVAMVLSLPEENRLVLSYLIRFLQIFSLPDVSSITKMDVNNLSMVWAPNCLRCPSDDPQQIFENTRKEMTFIRTLLRHLDTTYMEGIR